MIKSSNAQLGRMVFDMRKFVLVATTLATVVVGAPAAQATSGSGVSGVILAQTTVGDTDYILREITIQPGGYTGWHYHRGTLYAFVKSGTLAHVNADCSVDNYRTGAAFIEPSGAQNVHIGENRGSGVTVLDVLYVDPKGSALSEDAPARC